MSELTTAELTWREHAAPVSSQYGDVYFSIDDGLQESNYVFLKHNQLAERFAALTDSASEVFTIVETGFGTGLNFSLTIELWQRCAPANARLRYLSIEKHPLTVADLHRAYQHWPTLEPIAAKWIKHYPPLFPGRYICQPFDNIELWLAFNDVSEALDDCHPSLNPALRQHAGAVDAWFLDGFAPSKNPDMWQPSLFQAMAELSGSGTTFSTFTAAGFVKRGLSEAGFDVHKTRGFGRKRDMLCGTWRTCQSAVTSVPKGHTAPWYVSRPQARPQRVALIGAGIAGACIANALAKRDIDVSVFEQANDIAQNGSGNKQGVIYGKLSHRDEPASRFVTQALHFAHQYYQQWFESGQLTPGIEGELCGVAHLQQGEDLNLQEAFANSPHFVTFHQADDISQIANVPIPHTAMLVHGGGWLHPAAFCRAALNHANIKVHLGNDINTPVRQNNQWLINGDAFDAVVLATGSTPIAAAKYLPIKPIRGQVSHLQSDTVLSQLKIALCGKGYVAPAQQGLHCIGASFNLGDNSTTLNEEDHQHNLAHLSQAIPAIELANHVPSSLDGRVGFRGTSPDYLPLVGALVEPAQFCADFASLGKDATRSTAASDSYLEGLYALYGLGSKGLTYAPICAEHLASALCNELSPLPLNLQLALNPNRFLLRNIIKNKPQNF